MSYSINHYVGEGYLVRDPEHKSTAKGMAIVSGTLGVSHSYKKGEETVYKNGYIDFDAIGFLAERFRGLSKKDEIVIEGHFETEEWETKDGKKASKLKLKVEKVRQLVKKERKQDPAAPVQKPTEKSDDEPF